MSDSKEGSELGAVAPHRAAGQPPEGPPDSSTWPREGAASPVATPTGKGPSGPRAPPKKTPSRGKRGQAGAAKRAQKKQAAKAAPAPSSAAVLRRAAAATPRGAATGEGRARPRSGSENRQRIHVARIRLDDAEAVILEELASASGLAIGAYLRACGLKSVGVRAKPRPSVDRELLARANADLNRVGNNINQIARAFNSGLDLPFNLAEAMTDLRGALTAIRRAAGYDSQG